MHIDETSRSLFHLMEFCEIKNISGLLLTNDFEMIFDTIKWEYINKTLKPLILECRFETG